MLFYILKVLLEQKIIRFCTPEDPLGETTPYWEADSDTIINFFCEHWPKNVLNENDENLNIYFYEMPAILWRGDDGHYYGS